MVSIDVLILSSRVPVLHEVRDITMARTGDVALVSYENKVSLPCASDIRAHLNFTKRSQAPPQLWKLEIIKDTARLSLRHTYMPKVTVDFAGPSYFGGRNDQLVLCAGKGTIFLLTSKIVQYAD